MAVLAAACSVMGFFSTQAQTETDRVAGEARFDLEGDAATEALSEGYLIAGQAGDGGAVTRENWRGPEVERNSYVVTPRVTHYCWTAGAFRFTAQHSGMVRLTLMGPYVKLPDGSLAKEEILWDSLSSANSAISNGSFEYAKGGVPDEWERPYGDGAVESGWPGAVQGRNYARTWHSGPLSCAFQVQGGVPVTLRFYARAAVPAGYADMARLGSDTPAHRAARHFRHGVNLSDYLEAPPGGWGSSGYTVDDLKHIRAEGFDHVRIPVGWNYYAGPGPDFTIDGDFYPKVDFLVTNALAQGLAVIVNIHNWNEFATNAGANRNEFYTLWRQIAAHYAHYPETVAFELMNEPNGPGATTAILNPIYAEAIREIRQTDPKRTIFVGGSHWNAISELGNLRLPADDDNIIVTVHCYDPFYYTHQGASWPGPQTATVGIVFPGPPATPITPAAGIGAGATHWLELYNEAPPDANPSSPLAFESEMENAQAWSKYYGRPVHVGEFGAYTKGDARSRANFYHAIRTTMERLGLGWAMWDWSSGFRYWDEKTGEPAPGMREAMFGK